MTSPDPADRHAFPWILVVSVVAVMAVVVSALWLVIRQVDDSDLTTPEPTVAVASPPSTPNGTPPATPPAPATPGNDNAPVWPPGSLPALLAYSPDRLADDSLPLNAIAWYADIAGWMAARGVATPASLTDPALSRWEPELDNLAIPTSLRERGLDPVWQDAYGFNLTQVEQALIVGQAPDYVMILKGSFDADALQAAWVASGYQAVEVEGSTVWSLLPGDTIDLSAPASRPAMGTLNNVVLLEDGTLVAAAKTSRLGSVLDVVNDGAPSLAEQEDIAALLLPVTGAGELASAIISKGSLLQASDAAPESTPVTDVAGDIATPDSGMSMPELNVVLFGLSLPAPGDGATPVAGADPPRLTMLLVLDDLVDARVAREVIANRLAGDRSPVTGSPYVARYGAPTVSLLDGDDRAVVMVVSDLVQGPADWLDILDTRDFGFASWLPEE